MSKTLYGKRWYKPSEVARLGLIKNSTGGDNYASNYKFIIKLIGSGKLPAKNYGAGKTPYYLISENAINEYHAGNN